METSIIVSRPTTIVELHGAPVVSLSAGKLDSAAVIRGPNRDGEAWTWGCGKAGKLGHGSSEAAHAPFRVSTVVLAVGMCGAQVLSPTPTHGDAKLAVSQTACATHAVHRVRHVVAHKGNIVVMPVTCAP